MIAIMEIPMEINACLTDVTHKLSIRIHCQLLKILATYMPTSMPVDHFLQAIGPVPVKVRISGFEGGSHAGVALLQKFWSPGKNLSWTNFLEILVLV